MKIWVRRRYKPKFLLCSNLNKSIALLATNGHWPKIIDSSKFVSVSTTFLILNSSQKFIKIEIKLLYVAVRNNQPISRNDTTLFSKTYSQHSKMILIHVDFGLVGHTGSPSNKSLISVIISWLIGGQVLPDQLVAGIWSLWKPTLPNKRILFGHLSCCKAASK